MHDRNTLAERITGEHFSGAAAHHAAIDISSTGG
jgi:hypothetical protein